MGRSESERPDEVTTRRTAGKGSETGLVPSRLVVTNDASTRTTDVGRYGVPSAETSVSLALPERWPAAVREACREGSTKVFYLATAPSLFTAIAGNLHAAGLVDDAARLVEVARDPALAVNPKDIFSLDALEKRYGFKRSRGDEEIPTDAPAIPPL